MLSSCQTRIDFINILLEPHMYESALCSFSLVTFWLCDFLQMDISEKIERKMLMKLTQVGHCGVWREFPLRRNIRVWLYFVHLKYDSSLLLQKKSILIGRPHCRQFPSYSTVSKLINRLFWHQVLPEDTTRQKVYLFCFERLKSCLNNPEKPETFSKVTGTGKVVWSQG